MQSLCKITRVKVLLKMLWKCFIKDHSWSWGRLEQAAAMLRLTGNGEKEGQKSTAHGTHVLKADQYN
jgi:hypothetical protein